MRKPDFIIGPAENPYLLRWWVIPRNAWFNIYLHKIIRSDDDRALHDHPWYNLSIILKGGYWEHFPSIYFSPAMGGFPIVKRWRGRGSIVFRRPIAAHRLELETAWHPERKMPIPCWSLFITGPRIREWGFHCPKGWRHWKEFVKVIPGGNDIGAGCE